MATAYPANSDRYPSSTLLRKAYSRLFFDNTKFALFLTIQPNLGYSSRSRALASVGSSWISNDVERVWAILSKISFELDQAYNSCRSPKFLPPQKRFQGFAVLEKRETNPHLHILLTFNSNWERVFGYAFLLQAIDNVPAAEMQNLRADDVEREDDTWGVIRRMGGYSKISHFGPHDSIIEKYAPAGTVKVQWVQTDSDRRRVAWYMTKELKNASASTLSRNQWAWDNYFDYKELREFHSPMGVINGARQTKCNPQVSAFPYLDLDDLDYWICKDGKRV